MRNMLNAKNTLLFTLLLLICGTSLLSANSATGSHFINAILNNNQKVFTIVYNNDSRKVRFCNKEESDSRQYVLDCNGNIINKANPNTQLTATITTDIAIAIINKLDQEIANTQYPRISRRLLGCLWNMVAEKVRNDQNNSGEVLSAFQSLLNYNPGLFSAFKKVFSLPGWVCVNSIAEALEKNVPTNPRKPDYLYEIPCHFKVYPLSESQKCSDTSISTMPKQILLSLIMSGNKLSVWGKGVEYSYFTNTNSEILIIVKIILKEILDKLNTANKDVVSLKMNVPLKNALERLVQSFDGTKTNYSDCFDGIEPFLKPENFNKELIEKKEIEETIETIDRFIKKEKEAVDENKEPNVNISDNTEQPPSSTKRSKKSSWIGNGLIVLTSLLGLSSVSAQGETNYLPVSFQNTSLIPDSSSNPVALFNSSSESIANLLTCPIPREQDICPINNAVNSTDLNTLNLTNNITKSIIERNPQNLHETSRDGETQFSSAETRQLQITPEDGPHFLSSYFKLNDLSFGIGCYNKENNSLTLSRKFCKNTYLCHLSIDGSLYYFANGDSNQMSKMKINSYDTKAIAIAIINKLDQEIANTQYPMISKRLLGCLWNMVAEEVKNDQNNSGEVLSAFQSLLNYNPGLFSAFKEVFSLPRRVCINSIAEDLKKKVSINTSKSDYAYDLPCHFKVYPLSESQKSSDTSISTMPKQILLSSIMRGKELSVSENGGERSYLADSNSKILIIVNIILKEILAKLNTANKDVVSLKMNVPLKNALESLVQSFDGTKTNYSDCFDCIYHLLTPENLNTERIEKTIEKIDRFIKKEKEAVDENKELNEGAFQIIRNPNGKEDYCKFLDNSFLEKQDFFRIGSLSLKNEFFFDNNNNHYNHENVFLDKEGRLLCSPGDRRDLQGPVAKGIAIEIIKKLDQEITASQGSKISRRLLGYLWNMVAQEVRNNQNNSGDVLNAFKDLLNKHAGLFLVIKDIISNNPKENFSMGKLCDFLSHKNVNTDTTERDDLVSINEYHSTNHGNNSSDGFGHKPQKLNDLDIISPTLLGAAPFLSARLRAKSATASTPPSVSPRNIPLLETPPVSPRNIPLPETPPASPRNIPLPETPPASPQDTENIPLPETVAASNKPTESNKLSLNPIATVTAISLVLAGGAYYFRGKLKKIFKNSISSLKRCFQDKETIIFAKS